MMDIIIIADYDVMLSRFASGVIYFGLSLSTSTLAGNKYINFFLSGAVEAPAYFLTIFVLQKQATSIMFLYAVSTSCLCTNL